MSLEQKESVQIGLDSDNYLPIVVLSDNYITAKDKTDTRPNTDFENNIYANFGRSNSVSDKINNPKISNRKCILFTTVAIIILILINLVTLFILAETKGESQQHESMPTAAEQKMDFSNMKQLDSSDVAEYLDGKINRLQKRIKQLENSHEATVMFSAEAAKKTRIPGNGGTAVFETVMAEEGGGYDSTTGVFTCPVPGYYYFALHIMAPDDDRADLHLDHNGRIAVRAYAGPGGDNSASASVVLKLAVGDTVSAHTYIQAAVLHGGYGSLQGVLLKATL